VISIPAATGSHILRSHTLLVIEFRMTEMAANPTTNQIAVLENVDHPGNMSPARDNTITPINARTAALKTAATLIFGGYLPLNLPPMEYSPQGAPEAKAN
jgi:hypothetical protein